MKTIRYGPACRNRRSVAFAVSLGFLLAVFPGLMAGEEVPDPGEHQTVRLEVRIIEMRTDGTERVATRAATTLTTESSTDFFAWWGRLPEGAGLPLPEAGSEVAPRPALEGAAWLRVWQVQVGFHGHNGHGKLHLNLGKSRYDGPGTDGRPAYRRTLESLSFSTGDTVPRRWLMVQFTEEEANMVGVSRVMLELQVFPGDPPASTLPPSGEEGGP